MRVGHLSGPLQHDVCVCVCKGGAELSPWWFHFHYQILQRCGYFWSSGLKLMNVGLCNKWRLASCYTKQTIHLPNESNAKLNCVRCHVTFPSEPTLDYFLAPQIHRNRCQGSSLGHLIQPNILMSAYPQNCFCFTTTNLYGAAQPYRLFTQKEEGVTGSVLTIRKLN